MRFIVNVEGKQLKSGSVAESIRNSVERVGGVSKVTVRPITKKEEEALKNK